jgi:hypothetical protein
MAELIATKAGLDIALAEIDALTRRDIPKGMNLRNVKRKRRKNKIRLHNLELIKAMVARLVVLGYPDAAGSIRAGEIKIYPNGVPSNDGGIV